MPHCDYGVASWLCVNHERPRLAQTLHLDIATIFSIRVNIAGIELTRCPIWIQIVGFASLPYFGEYVIRHCPELFALRRSSRRPDFESGSEERWSWAGSGNRAGLRRAS